VFLGAKAATAFSAS